MFKSNYQQVQCNQKKIDYIYYFKVDFDCKLLQVYLLD